jgi:hypothetical protein
MLNGLGVKGILALARPQFFMDLTAGLAKPLSMAS